MDRPPLRDQVRGSNPEVFSTKTRPTLTGYEKNADAFTKRATALGDALIAAKERAGGHLKLLTYHDAYAYFAETYGWDVIGAVQPKNFEDPTPQEVASSSTR